MNKKTNKIIVLFLALLMLIPNTVFGGKIVEPKIDISYEINEDKIKVDTVKERDLTLKILEGNREIYLGQGKTDLDGLIYFDIILEENIDYIAKVNVDGYVKEKKIRIEKDSSTDPVPGPGPIVPEGSSVYIYIKGYKGTILNKVIVPIESGDTVLDITLRELDKKGIQYTASGGYISSIAGQREFDKGKDSGWMYSVNGKYPNYGAGEYYLKNGDSIEWRYTYDLGVDLGVDNSSWVLGDQDKEIDKDQSKEDNLDKEDKKNILSEKLNLETHIKYIEGYEDGTIKGAQNITREEVATMIYRVLNPTYRVDIETNEHDFKDLSKDAWSSKYVATLSNGNILKGYPDGNFNAKNPLTRAEATAMLTRFLDEETENKDSFKDIENHWAEKEIELAISKGWIKGYEDNTFKPNNEITRGELVTMINRVLERETKLENMLEGRKEFKDLSKTDWYYEAIQEAANGHTYEKVNGVEVWKSLKDFN